MADSAASASTSSPGAGNSHWRRSQPVSACSSSQQRSTSCRNTPPSRYRSRPMLACCTPPPGKRKTTPGGCGGTSVAWPGGAAAEAARCRPSTAMPMPSATTARRWPKARRPCCRVWATSSSDRPLPACCRWAARRRADSSSARGLRADSGSTCQPRAASACVREGAAEVAGAAAASCSTTWTLVPPMPKALTPARRGVAAWGQGLATVLTWKGLRSKSICGCGRSKCRLGGKVACLSESTVLIRPVTPAAASRWPILVFTEPMAQ